MLSEAVAGAENIAAQIANDSLGKKWKVSAEDASKAAGGKKLTTNDLTVMRRAIPFVSNTPIVREREDDSRTRTYVAMSQEEFENYKFTEKNFYKLPMADIIKIRKRILEKYPDTDQIEILRLLTICDYAVKIGADTKYVKLPRRILAVSLGLKKSKELKDRIDILERCGIFNVMGDTVQYNAYFNDTDKSPDKEIDIHRRTEKENTLRQKSLDTAHTQLEQIGVYIDSLMQENKLLYQKAEDLKTENTKLLSAYKEEHTRLQSMPAILESYQKLREDNDKKREEIEKAGLLVKNMAQYRKAVDAAVQTTLAKMTKDLMTIVDQYQKDHRDAELTLKVNALAADTVSSIRNVIKKAGVK